MWLCVCRVCEIFKARPGPSMKLQSVHGGWTPIPRTQPSNPSAFAVLKTSTSKPVGLTALQATSTIDASQKAATDLQSAISEAVFARRFEVFRAPGFGTLGFRVHTGELISRHKHKRILRNLQKPVTLITYNFVAYKAYQSIMITAKCLFTRMAECLSTWHCAQRCACK